MRPRFSYNIVEKNNNKRVADMKKLKAGAYKKMTHEEILKIFEECK